MLIQSKHPFQTYKQGGILVNSKFRDGQISEFGNFWQNFPQVKVLIPKALIINISINIDFRKKNYYIKLFTINISSIYFQ